MVHFRELVKNRKFGRAIGDATRYFGARGRLSRLYLSKRWQIVFASKSQVPGFPAWLSEDLDRRLGLRDRWASIQRPKESKKGTSGRPEAIEAVASDLWANLFESFDAGATHLPIEVRHPIFDLRLLDFLLALPRLPWCCDKELFREANRGQLPDSVRLRRKSPLSADPLNALLRKPESKWVDEFEPVSDLAAYVVRQKIPPVYCEREIWSAWIHLRPLSLDYWLRLTDA